MSLKDLSIFYELKLSSQIMHFNHTTTSANSFHLELFNRIDAVWLALFINQNTILHTLNEPFKEDEKGNSPEKHETHISEISSEIPYCDFLTHE